MIQFNKFNMIIIILFLFFVGNNQQCIAEDKFDSDGITFFPFSNSQGSISQFSLKIPQDFSRSGNVSITEIKEDIINLPPWASPISDTIRIEFQNIKASMKNKHISISFPYNEDIYTSIDTVHILRYNFYKESWDSLDTIIDEYQSTVEAIFFPEKDEAFVVVNIDITKLEESATTKSKSSSGFSFANDSWQFDNFSNTAHQSGNCYGMVGYASFFYSETDDDLRDYYSETEGKIVASQAHTILDGIIGELYEDLGDSVFSNDGQFHSMTYIKLLFGITFNKPQILLIGDASNFKYHAILAYSFSNDQFTVYDPNDSGRSKIVDWDNVNHTLFYSTDPVADRFTSVGSLSKCVEFCMKGIYYYHEYIK